MEVRGARGDAQPAVLAPLPGDLRRHGFVPTYLVASEIVEDDYACELLAGLLKRGTAEVGTHLHPWTTPPYVDRPGLRYNDEIHAYPSQLPADLLDEKTGTLTQTEAALGVSPKVFRAGRFGFDASCATILRARGYELDSSVTPYVRGDPAPASTAWAGRTSRDSRPTRSAYSTAGSQSFSSCP